MQEDETVRTYVKRITDITTCIKRSRGTISKDEVCSKILISLTPTYGNKVNVIEKFIHLIKYFNRETLIGKLQAFKTSRLTLPRVETTFRASAYNAKRILTKSACTSGSYGDYASDWKYIQEEEKKIDELVSLIAKTKPKGGDI